METSFLATPVAELQQRIASLQQSLQKKGCRLLLLYRKLIFFIFQVHRSRVGFMFLMKVSLY